MKIYFVLQCEMTTDMFISSLSDGDVMSDMIRGKKFKTITRCESCNEMTFEISDEDIGIKLLDIIADHFESTMGLDAYNENWEIVDNIEKMKITNIDIRNDTISFKLTFDTDFHSYEATLIEKLIESFKGEIVEIYTERKTV